MIKFVEYNPDINGNCVLRSFTKITGKDFDIVKAELLELAKDMGHVDYTDIEVFENYLHLNSIDKIDVNVKNRQIKDLDFSGGKYSVFCWDKGQIYHMVTIIDNVLYDKNESTLNLYPISIYKEKTTENE